MEHDSRLIDVAHEGRLGDLEPQGARFQAVGVDGRDDPVDKTRVGKLGRRDVQREADVGAAGPPGGDLPAGGVQHECTELDHQPVALGRLEEGVRP